MDRETPTRSRLLDAIKHGGPQPVRVLCAELGISAMAVRQHLTVLERDGLVQRRAMRRPLGRPEHLYGLTPEAEDCFPKRYDVLAGDLLEHTHAALGARAVQKVLQSRLEAQVELLEPRLRGRDAAGRLRELAAIQNENGFMASVDVRRGELVQHNCNVCAVACRFPEICAGELALFERLLGARVERLEHMVRGDTACRYRVVPEPAIEPADEKA